MSASVEGGPAERSGEFVQSLARGLAVIQSFDAHHPRLTLSDVARKTGLARAAARRFLYTLIELGYVDTDGKTFGLRARVLEIGYAYLASLSLPELAVPHMEPLVEATGASCSMSVLDGADVFYVARVPTRHRLVLTTIPVGTRFPAYATAMGRVLLSALPAGELHDFLASQDFGKILPRTKTDPVKLKAAIQDAGNKGYAIVQEELREGLASVAVPIHDREGKVIAALNLSTHGSRGTLAVLRRELLPPLIETARALESDLMMGRRRPELSIDVIA
jgi:IclR family pca regulon transcriptional regulator